MALDTDPSIPGEEGGEERPEPIYPKGPPLRVQRAEVQLTFLDPAARVDASPTPAGEEGEEPEFQSTTPLGVRIPVFDGPLDLLLYLIRRDQLDIYDIPLGHITAQYLEMLQAMHALDLDLAGEFLVMAATLMRLKARMLLPTWPEGEEEEEDPRAELVRQLLEYRRFREAARRLQGLEEERRRWFGRGFIPVFEGELPAELEPVSHFALIEVMKEVLARAGEQFFYEVTLEDVTVEEKTALVAQELAAHGRVLFLDLLVRFPRRLHVVVTFMALLEMARQGRVAIAQEANFGQIWVYPALEGRILLEGGPGVGVEERAEHAEAAAPAPAPSEDSDGIA